MINTKHLEALENSVLVNNMKKLVASERQNQAAFIAHLFEVMTRKLYLVDGYSNIIEYCRQNFGLSEGSAYKRMQIARRSRRFPVLLDFIADQKLSLTVVCMLCSHLSESNIAQRLQMSLGKSKREVERMIRSWDPKPEPPESTRKSRTSSSSDRSHIEQSCPGSGFAPKIKDTQTPSTPTTDLCASSRARHEKLEILSEQRTHLKFSISSATEQKLQRAKEILASKTEFDGSLENVFDLALDALLEKRDPAKRQQRREQRKTNANDKSDLEGTNPESRYIPQKLKDDLLAAADYRCSYVASGTGKRCGCKSNLHIDHQIPYGMGGKTQRSNLQVLCQKHNLLKAQQQYGRKKMSQYINSRC